MNNDNPSTFPLLHCNTLLPIFYVSENRVTQLLRMHTHVNLVDAKPSQNYFLLSVKVILITMSNLHPISYGYSYKITYIQCIQLTKLFRINVTVRVCDDIHIIVFILV